MNKIFNFFLFCFLFSILYPLPSTLYPQIRQPVVAGQFYPADKTELNAFIDNALLEAKVKPVDGKIIALVVPHAGYVFSGGVAAYSYKLIAGKKYDTVILLGAAHTMSVKGAALYSKGFFETPLGKVKIDEKLSKTLLKEADVFEDNTSAHLREHSLEVQIPFLQKVLKPDFEILPIVLNTEDLTILKKIGEILAKHLKNKNAIIIISSDLSHYPSSQIAEKADNTTLLALRTMDPEYFYTTNRILLDRGERGLNTLWCGESAVISGLVASKILGANNSVVLKYAHSYQTNPRYGEPDRVVGYASVVWTDAPKVSPFKISLNENQKKFLLKLARETISLKLDGKQKKGGLLDDYFLNLPGAVFVTLTKNGNLRGCIGTVQPRMTIYEAVIHSANSAAFEDNRFSPLKKEEFEKVKIEISFLSPLKQVSSADEVVPHKHGVVITRGSRSGLFLPQVWEKIPDKEDFLDEICTQKAGLEVRCWKNKNSKIYIFTVDSFEEK